MKFDFIKKLNILKRKKILTTILVACFLFLVACFIFLYQLYIPLSKNVEEKIFIIEKGEGLEKIAENLRIERMVSNDWLFIFYVWLKGGAKNLQAGKYSLSSSMNTPQVAKKIISGDIVHDWVKVTIPEGWDIKKIEEKLKESEVIGRDEKIPQENEGYLFPDTYYFDKENTIVEIAVKKMLTNFGEKLTPDLRDEIKRQEKTIHQIVVMASILEKEVKSDEDRAIVSGIFWKRLKNNYPLESCATIAYILGVDKWRYSYQDTRIKSPYNTYINVGLPPTPINNPGLSAIKAAIYSQETDYNFFLNAPDGATIFSKTLDEHNKNKVKYFQ